MSDFVEKMLAFARSKGRVFYEVAGGIGIPFEDGYDSFWLLPEEKWYWVNRDLKEGVDVVELFCDVEQRRLRVLDAVRRCLAENGIYRYDARDGGWGVKTPYCSTSMSVGPVLTRYLMGDSDMVACILNVLEGGLVEKPSEKLVGEYLSAYGTVFEEVPTFEDDQIESDTDVVAMKGVSVSAIELPEPSVEQLAINDNYALGVMCDYLKTIDAVYQYSNKLYFDSSIDRWACKEDWRWCAERYVGEGANAMHAALILLSDLGDGDRELDFMGLVSDDWEQGEIYDEGEEELEMVWRHRNRSLTLAENWLDPDRFCDFPWLEVRASLGDPVAAQYLVMSVVRGDVIDVQGFCGEGLLRVPTDLLRRFVSEDIISSWRLGVVAKVKRCQDWGYGGAFRSVALASKMGWDEVVDLLDESRWLVRYMHGPCGDDGPGILASGGLLLNWSSLSASEGLKRLVSSVLDETFLEMMAMSHIERGIGRKNASRNSKKVRELKEYWLNQIKVPLAIAWLRCRAAEGVHLSIHDRGKK